MYLVLDAVTQTLTRVIINPKTNEQRREPVDQTEHRNLMHRIVLSGDIGHVALPGIGGKTVYIPVKVEK